MKCVNCNGDMNGDGYSSVMTCENLSGGILNADEGPEYAAPDEAVYYCDHADVNLLDRLTWAELRWINNKWYLYLTSQDEGLYKDIHFVYVSKGVDGATVYLGECQGFMNYMIDPSPKRKESMRFKGGCGGDLTMYHGHTVSLEGCWSSNPSTMVKTFGIEKPFEAALDHMSIAMTPDLLSDIADRFGFKVANGRPVPEDDVNPEEMPVVSLCPVEQ